jgi:hypothetical protein
MLTPFCNILEKKLHTNEIYTSFTVPHQIFDPKEKNTRQAAYFLCEKDGTTYYATVADPWNASKGWFPTREWILEKNNRAKPLGESSFTDTYWIKWSDIKGLHDTSVQTTIKEEKKDMKNAVITGAKLALANEAGDVAVNVIVDMVPGIAPHMENPAARALAKLLGAFVLSHSADVVGKEHADTVRTTADLVATAATMELTQSQLKRLTPAVEQLVALGKKIV